MKTLLSFAFVMCAWCMTITAQIKIWDKRFGGSDYDDLTSSLATSDGAYLLGGHSSSNIGGDKTEPPIGGTDFWVVKIDESGSRLWDRRYGGKLDESMSLMLPSTGRKFLLGGWTSSEPGAHVTEPGRGRSDYWIVQIDQHGNKLWDRRFGGDWDDHLISMAPARDGGYLLGGSSYSNAGGDVSENSRGSDDYWVVKIDKRGNKLWDKRYGGHDSDLLTEILPLRDGGFLLAGRSSSNISGEKTENSRGEFDYWVVRIDKEGNKLWDKTYGGALYDLPTKLFATPDGGFFIGGQSDSDISGEVTRPSRSPGFDDFWLVKIDRHGNKLWDQRYGGNHADGLRDIQSTGDGKYLIGGWSYSDVSGERSEPPRDWGEFWLLKIDASGAKMWDKSYGGDQYESIYDITPMTDGNFLLAGSSQTDLNGDKTEHTRGGLDFWAIKFSPLPPRRILPRDFLVYCSPLCPPLDLDIRSWLFDGIAAFSLTVALPEGKAAFNKTGHTAAPELQKGISFEIINEYTMRVTWKSNKEISLPDETTILTTSINILDDSSSFETCVSDVEAFDRKGNRIEFGSGCGRIEFKNSNVARVARMHESSSTAAPSSIAVFPNPGTGVFNITLPRAGAYNVAIRDSQGSVLSVNSVSATENNLIWKVDLRESPPGMYLVTISDGFRLYAGKILKR